MAKIISADSLIQSDRIVLRTVEEETVQAERSYDVQSLQDRRKEVEALIADLTTEMGQLDILLAEYAKVKIELPIKTLGEEIEIVKP